ncbi:MAG TPA: hypothetical protein VK590_08000 [Saprospiraceae bacterium]|nr:hypothetical protein [Saprospiraceae bacterium]
MPIVELPDGQNAEFPDSMPLDKIKSVIQQKFPPKVDTAIGQMQQPNIRQMTTDSKMVDEMIRGFATGPGLGAQGLYNIPKLSESISNIPQVKNSVSMLMQKFPQLAPKIMSGLRSAENPFMGALMGGANSPENPIAGMAMGGAAGMVPGALNAIKPLGETIQSAFSKVNPREVMQKVKSRHDALLGQASELFNHVGNIAKDRNIGEFDIDPKLINQIKNILPDTTGINNLMESVNDGSYQSLRKLQSELWKRGTKRLESDIPSENDVGEKMMDLRESLNNKMISHFRDIGHEDLADKLLNAKSIYKDLKDIYYSVPSISKMVGKSRKMPRNILSVLKEESEEMKRLKQENPFLDDLLIRDQQKKNSMKTLKNLGNFGVKSLGGVGLASLGLLGTKKGYDYLTGE